MFSWCFQKGDWIKLEKVGSYHYCILTEERTNPDINHIRTQNGSSETILIAQLFCLFIFWCTVEKNGFCYSLVLNISMKGGLFRTCFQTIFFFNSDNISKSISTVCYINQICLEPNFHLYRNQSIDMQCKIKCLLSIWVKHLL